MPGDEIGDRVHNFFDPDNLSQSQLHPSVVNVNWPVLNASLWDGKRRQIGEPNISNLKNSYFQPSSDSQERIHQQSSQVLHGMNFAQSSMRSELYKIQSQNQQPHPNGYLHGHRDVQARETASNFMGVDREHDQQNPTSVGLFILESLSGSGSEQDRRCSMRHDTFESPVNFDFFHGQQQMGCPQSGMLQTLPRQQSELGDMHLVQQQVMLKRMQELQRRHHFQQQEVRHRNSMDHFSPIERHVAGNNSSALINGSEVHGVSSSALVSGIDGQCLIMPEFVAGNTNWFQHDASLDMQGSSNGILFSPEQGQAMHLTNLGFQQVDQSLYGFPFSDTRVASSQFGQTDKPAMEQVPASNNSLSENAHDLFADPVGMQDRSLVSRHGFQGKNFFRDDSSQRSTSGVCLENSQLQNTQKKNVANEFEDKQRLANPSESFQEKSTMQVAPSQPVVPLDPTEERILFGSDDNIWDAFGRKTNAGIAGFSLLDGTTFPNGLPSILSGSWSALMQSAVAESSGGGIELQEGGSGLNFSNSLPPAVNLQMSTFSESVKQHDICADRDSQKASSPGSKLSPFSSSASMRSNTCNVQEFQQVGLTCPNEKDRRFQLNSSNRFIQQSSDDGNKWLDCSPMQKPLSGGSQIFRNAVSSLNTESNAKSNSDSCIQHNGWNFMKTTSPGASVRLKTCEKEKAQPSQNSEHPRVMTEEVTQSAALPKDGYLPNLTMATPWLNIHDSSLNTVASIPYTTKGATKNNQETNQKRPFSHQHDNWRSVDLSVGSADEGSVKFQDYGNKGPQIFESLVSNSLKEAVEKKEINNHNRKENYSGCHPSNLSHQASSGGSRGNVWSEPSARALLGGKQTPCGQLGRKSSGPRRFQYHPMGNLEEDVESYYGSRYASCSETTSQQVSQGLRSNDQCYLGQSKFLGNSPKVVSEMEKGSMKGLEEVPSKGILPGQGHAPNISSSKDLSSCMGTPSRIVQSSQNMLELLHKVDQSREHRTMDSTDRNPAYEISHGGTSGGGTYCSQRNHASTSQGFGLQLAPPSQRLSIGNHALSSHPPPTSSIITPGIGDKGHTWLGSISGQSFPDSREILQVEVSGNMSSVLGHVGSGGSQSLMQGSVYATSQYGSPFSSGQLQNKPMNGIGGHTIQSVDTSSSKRASPLGHMDGFHDGALIYQSAQPFLHVSGSMQHRNLASPAATSQPANTDKSHLGDPVKQIPISDVFPETELPALSGTSQHGAFSNMLPTSWIDVSTQQHLFGAQTCRTSSSMETGFVSPKRVSHVLKEDGNGLSETGTSSMRKENLVQQTSTKNIESPRMVDLSQGKETVVSHYSEMSPLNVVTKGDIEAFGRCLKPDSNSQRNCSLLHQEQAMKNTESDLSNCGLKRFGSDGDSGNQQLASDVGKLLSGESRTFNFSSQPGDEQDMENFSALGNESSKVTFIRNDSQNRSASSNTASVRSEHSQISPQMAPSWFDECGTYNNRQMLPTSNLQGTVSAKTAEQPITIGISAGSLQKHVRTEQVNASAGASQVGDVQQNSSSTPYTPAISDEMLAVRPKKRKSAPSELLSWHKEVTHGSLKLHIMSMTEAEWAEAANRLVEKVEHLDEPPLFRPKRRLILTTQLMQQLLRPPPPSVLSLDSKINYDCVAYFAARIVSGDACSLLINSQIDGRVSLDCETIPSETLKVSGGPSDRSSEVLEGLIGRTRKVENDLLRLDKKASIVDLRVECQDLEKFSVINRFAKFQFHGRGQAEGAEALPSSDAPSFAHVSCPQRYVTAVPMSIDLPDRVQCLSL